MTQAWYRRGAVGTATLVLCAAIGRPLHAQGTVTGRVTTAATDLPLGNARVLVIGGNASAVTGDDGRFTLRNVSAGAAELQVLHVGYQSQKKGVTVKNGATDTLNFQLSIAVTQLEAVVTTATGQQRKVELGNAVTTLGDVGKMVETREINNVADMLTAKAPGVVVLPGSSLGGAPTVRIRGVSSISLSNAPIYYVDGVRYAGNNLSSGTDTQYSLLNSINPEEIENVEVVKGPSAATLYGTNAANGVVLITTKKGRAGKAQWNWSGEGGIVDDRTAYQDMYANWGHAPNDPKRTPIRCQLATMGPNTCISDSLTHYNWLRDPDNTFVVNGNRSLYGVNVRGGNEAIRYFVSGDLEKEQGPIEMPWYDRQRFDSMHVTVQDNWLHPSALQRSAFRANLSAAVSPKLDLNISTGFNKIDNRIPPESDLIIALYYVGMQNYGFKGPGLDKITTQVDGTPLHDALQWNPGDIMQVTQNNDVQRFTGSSDLSWRPLSWLTNDGTVGVDFAAVDFFQLCRLNECPPQSATARLGRVTDNQHKFRNFSAKFSSNAAWNARSWLNFKTSVGGDYTNIESDSAYTNGTTLPPGASSVSAAATRTGANQQPTAVKTLGAYVQEQASIHDRLFLTVAARTDQNSAFGTNFQRVVYPKYQVSWLITEEPFFPKVRWLDELRLRTSYGASGVQPGATASLVTYSASSVSIPGRASTSGTDTPALTANQPGNPDLKPERSGELETGFEATFLKSHVHVDYTYYRKQTKDALINIALAPSTAAAQLSPLINLGATRNWGHELQVNAQLIDTRPLALDVTLSGSHNDNKVVDLGIDPNTGQERVIGTGQTRQVVGLPLFSQWFRTYTYNDANHDGILQVNEVIVDTAFKYVGRNSAANLVSVQSGLDLFAKRLRINAMFDYKGGGYVQDGANNFQCNTAPFSCRETQDPTAPLAWQARSIAKYYGTTIAGSTYKTSVGYFMPVNFWRFRELSAVYQLPRVLTHAIRAQDGSNVVLAARNLKLWTNFTGIDPEANYGVNGSENQNEFQTAGPPTYFTFRFNLRY